MPLDGLNSAVPVAVLSEPVESRRARFGPPAAVRGVNVIGMRRQKLGPEVRAAIKQAYKLLYRSGLNFSQVIARIEEEIKPCPEITEICHFFKNTKRGVAPAFGDSEEPHTLEEIPVEAI